MIVAAMEYQPVGYRFHPTDEELLNYYLMRKNLGVEDVDCIIPEVDLYRWEPRELPRKFSESSIVQSNDLKWWFFCEQKQGRTQQRSTKGGFWKKTGVIRDVKSRYGTKEVIGSKKVLTFFRGNSSNSMKTDWIMHEYHLPSNALDGLLAVNRKNYVLRLIKCNLDERADHTLAYECEWDEAATIVITDLLEPECEFYEPMTSRITNVYELEADSGFIPEHMEDKQSQKLKSTHGSIPIDGKKGIVEDDSTQATASLRVGTPKVKSEKESFEIISEANALKHVAIKIIEEISSAGSSSTNSISTPRKPVTQVEGLVDATSPAKNNELSTMASLIENDKLAQELKLLVL